ncbi:MAG TPA: 1-(5-phosphoribosyl)-5-[(5-phosphoribosylamino)methylideneamino]imidazole-4-carboxamide isomerase [Candidatus Faecicola pullistercoris]|nr:1-(5-phosphoribosyl)-5-[(5-phosphoribosylamino)methylideneamino]imidazole-4-carboxamide isomerase [Candidatus Faecicola pullistercoris]
MQIYPAIDLKNKQVVRLYKGDYAKVTVYSDNPVATALSFKEAGAGNIHLVDLDGAKEGSPVNYGVIKDIVSETQLFAEVGGGIRDMRRIENYLKAGAGRVILGTAALENPDFLAEAVKEFGGSVAVGIDAKDGKVATRGWLDVSDTDAAEFAVRVRDAGVKTVIYTDISKDGTLSGTNMEVYGKLVKIGGLNVIASGGITYIDEIRQLARVGVYGAILGKALYAGLLNLADALRAAEESV